MRTLHAPEIDRLRIREPWVKQKLGSYGDHKGGVFRIPSICNRSVMLVAIACSSDGWDHVSVSLEERIPFWVEMEQVKRLFFKPNEIAFQLHPAEKDYIDGSWPGGRALHTLHIWRCTLAIQPMPPRYMIGGNSPEEHAENSRDDIVEQLKERAITKKAGLEALTQALQTAQLVLRSEAATSAIRLDPSEALGYINAGLDYLSKARKREDP